MKANTLPQGDRFPQASRPAGIGLRAEHYKDILEQRPDIGWIEVHPENFFGGGAHRHYLRKARELYPLSLHAVGLSLGAAQPVSREHLRRFRELIDEFEPFQVSDHASWSMSGNAHLNDLLPLPYNEESLQTLCDNVDTAQEMLGRKMLVENPSTYLAFEDSTMTEYEFMNEVANRTGCGILLDSNNIFVQSNNHGFDAYEYINGIDARHVGEMHLAGHLSRTMPDGETILIDTHDDVVCDGVWDLYEHAVSRFGVVPTLIEWDQKLPDLNVLVEEARHAERILFANTQVANAAE